MARGDETNFGVLAERVQDRNIGGTAEAEDNLDPEQLKIFNQLIRGDPITLFGAGRPNASKYVAVRLDRFDGGILHSLNHSSRILVTDRACGKDETVPAPSTRTVTRIPAHSTFC